MQEIEISVGQNDALPGAPPSLDALTQLAAT
jgi:hypothetical protein